MSVFRNYDKWLHCVSVRFPDAKKVFRYKEGVMVSARVYDANNICIARWYEQTPTDDAYGSVNPYITRFPG